MMTVPEFCRMNESMFKKKREESSRIQALESRVSNLENHTSNGQRSLYWKDSISTIDELVRVLNSEGRENEVRYLDLAGLIDGYVLNYEIDRWNIVKISENRCPNCKK